MKHDVIVIGLGVAGASAAWRLAERGVRVLGVDRFTPPHTMGSSHGETRVTREAYFEQPLYVPLLRDAREMWLALERQSGVELRRTTGVLNLGIAGGRVAAGAIASAREHDVSVEVLAASEVRRRFRGLAPDADMVGVYEPAAGLLFPEACVSALHAAATAAGAVLLYDEPVTALEPTSDGVVVRTVRARYVAGSVVVAAGAWLPLLLPDLALPLLVERQVSAWFAAPAHLRADRCPVTLWEVPDGTVLYTCPDVGDGFKAALHHNGAVTTAETADRTVGADDVVRIRERVARYLPGAGGAPLRFSVCLYTNTPDDDFILDAHPRDARVVIASACSGHGFKFGPVVGEIVADLVQRRSSVHDLAPFRIERFANASCDGPGRA